MKKVLLIIGIVVIVIAVGVTFLVFKAKAILAEGSEVIAEAEAFGKEATQQECLDESIRRFEACDGVMCEMMATPFAANCLFEAAPSSGFCDDVPTTEGTDGGESWRQQQCRTVVGGDETCQGMFMVVQGHCHPG